MKKAFALLLLLFALPLTAHGQTETLIEEIGVSTVFPDGYTVITPDTVVDHFNYFDAPTPEIAAEMLRSEGVYAIAFSAEGDVRLRLIAEEGDDVAAVYYDIERYTPAMRKAIADDFLDRVAWALTGYRYSEAEWSNKAAKGRMLNLSYTLRQQDEIIARGMQAYTIRRGMAYTLDLQVWGRQISSADKKDFAAFVAATAFPASIDMPPLPLPFTLTRPLPEETATAALTLRGETLPGTTITAWLQGTEGAAQEVAQAVAKSSGNFRLDFTLPGEGEYRLHLLAEMEDYADALETLWIHYDPIGIPVNFTSMPIGDVLDAQVVVAGKTLGGTRITWQEGDTIKNITTPGSGEFSFKPDRAITGERSIHMRLENKGYTPRDITLTFNRKWQMADHIKYLQDKVQALSYQNLYDNPQKYIGRLIRYRGTVVNTSQLENRTYVELALTTAKDGTYQDRMIAVGEDLFVSLLPGDEASFYVAVTGETYGFSSITPDGDEINLDLPSVTLLAYE